MNKIVTEKEYEIHYYEVDYNKKLLLTSLMDYLGDIATYQSEILGVGMDFIRSKGWGWVLYKWDVRIHKYPMYGETIKIATSAYGFKKFYAYRKFQIFNAQGEVIGEADSVWLLLELPRKRPVRIEEEIFKAYNIPLDCEDSIELEEIEKLESIDIEKIFNVRYSDIDTNKHVNNVKYAAWALEALPLEVVTRYSLTRIRITYIKETKYGETIKSKIQYIEKDKTIRCLHSIEDSQGKELTRLETFWN